MAPSRVFVIGPVSWNLLVRVADLPAAEPHAVFAQWHHECLGGTSAGKTLNLRRLGVEVSLCTLIGDDRTGAKIRRALEPSGVDLIVRRSANGSERHVNLMDAAGRRLSIYLTLPEPGAPVPARQDAALAAADAVIVDLADHSRQALPAARALGKPVWCDLHDYDGRSAFQAEFLEAADYLFVSDERLPDPHRFLHEQIAAGKRLAVCTRGAQGALALVPGAEIVEVAAEPVAEVVDTNGAGDAFFAGFLSAHLAGEPLRACLDLATSTAAACVRSPELAAGF
jgi:sugar/nucleoside kinase (ribokinase family)